MIPLKAKELVPQAAKDLHIPEEHLSIMLNSFYSALKSDMSILGHQFVYAEGLGTFFFKHWTVDKEIKKFEGLAEHGRFPYLRERADKQSLLLRAMREQIITNDKKLWNIRKARENNEHFPNITQYNKGCRCEGCIKAKTDYNKKQLIKNKGKAKLQKQYGVHRETTDSLEQQEPNS